MGIQVYSLSPLGHAVARSTHAPNNPDWRIIHFLDLAGARDKTQIAEYCGLGQGEASAALIKLKHKRVIAEETGTEV